MSQRTPFIRTHQFARIESVLRLRAGSGYRAWMRGDPVNVWLVDNGRYWKAAWRDGGRLKSRSLGNKDKLSRRRALDACRRLANDLAGECTGEAPRLSAWLDTYSRLRSDVKDTTLSTYRDCGIYLRAHFDADPLISDITRADAAEWLAAMSAGELTVILNRADDEAAEAAAAAGAEYRSRKRWKTLSLSTIRRHVRTAKQIFAEAVGQDLIPINPFQRLIGSPPNVERDWKQVTIEDMTRIIDACPNNGWRCLFALARFAGLRLNEAVDLRWGDIDWQGNRMLIHARLETESTKARRRVVPIEPAGCPSGLTDILRAAYDAAPAGALNCCHGVPVNNVRRDALGILRRSGVGAYAKPLHTLRKCLESEWASRYPLHVVVEWLGNSPEVARRHYLRVPEELYASPDAVKIGHGIGSNGGNSESVYAPQTVGTRSAKSGTGKR